MGEVKSYCRREFTRDFLVMPDGTAKEYGRATIINDWAQFERELRKADYREV